MGIDVGLDYSIITSNYQLKSLNRNRLLGDINNIQNDINNKPRKKFKTKCFYG